jgi:hypothetical protein
MTKHRNHGSFPPSTPPTRVEFETFTHGSPHRAALKAQTVRSKRIVALVIPLCAEGSQVIVAMTGGRFRESNAR